MTGQRPRVLFAYSARRIEMMPSNVRRVLAVRAEQREALADILG